MPDGKPKVTQEMRRAFLALTPEPRTRSDMMAEAAAEERARQQTALVDHFAQELGLDGTDLEVRARILNAARGWYGESETVTFRRLARTAQRTHDPVVYYMRQGGLVKIGTTASIAQRMEQIQPQGVMALEFGDRTREAERHQQFGHLHDHTEWFRLADDLGAHIADLREQFQVVTGLTVESWLEERLPPRRRRKFSA